MFSVSAQVVAYLVDAGFSQLQAATAWGFSGVTLLFGMFSIAWLDTVIGRRRSVLFSYTLSISGIAMLWLLKKLSRCVAADRIRNRFRQHGRLARASDLGDRD
jgi:hypothetical protein